MHTCHCCGGQLPPKETWEANRDNADNCTGSIDPTSGRCRAYADDALWIHPEVAEYVADHADDDEHDESELRRLFAIAFDRDPDEDDEAEGLWSHLVSAAR